MIVIREQFLQWAQWLLPAMPALAGRRKPGVRWQARNGAEIALRIVRMADADKIQSFVKNLSMKTRYYRFFYPLHELTPDLLERSLHADPMEEVTLLATTGEGDDEIVIGMAQYFVTGEERAEFAIVVADDWQRQGIGKSTLYALSWLARAAGIVWFVGDVLMENNAMRNMLLKSGYEFRSHPDGGNVVRATRRLSRPREKCSRLETFLTQIGAVQAGESELRSRVMPS